MFKRQGVGAYGCRLVINGTREWYESGKGAGRGHHCLCDGFHLLSRLHALKKDDVGPRRHGGAEPADGLAEADALERVGAGDDDDVVFESLAGGIGGADARYERVDVDQLLAEKVATPLGCHLVFNVETGDVSEHISLYLWKQPCYGVCFCG